jgi:hypothetical protein
MPHHDDHDETTISDDSEPIDTFLTQPPFVETPGLDEAAVEREKLLHPGPDPESIVEAVELLRERHSYE